MFGQVPILSPSKGVEPVSLPPADLADLAKLVGRGFAGVASIQPYGLDLDHEGRADLAFVDLCIEKLAPSGMCSPQTAVAVPRSGAGWKLTKFCLRSQSVPSCQLQ
jgi:hypothetical protein